MSSNAFAANQRRGRPSATPAATRLSIARIARGADVVMLGERHWDAAMGAQRVRSILPDLSNIAAIGFEHEPATLGAHVASIGRTGPRSGVLEPDYEIVIGAALATGVPVFSFGVPGRHDRVAAALATGDSTRFEREARADDTTMTAAALEAMRALRDANRINGKPVLLLGGNDHFTSTYDSESTGNPNKMSNLLAKHHNVVTIRTVGGLPLEPAWSPDGKLESRLRSFGLAKTENLISRGDPLAADFDADYINHAAQPISPSHPEMNAILAALESTNDPARARFELLTTCTSDAARMTALPMLIPHDPAFAADGYEQLAANDPTFLLYQAQCLQSAGRQREARRCLTDAEINGVAGAAELSEFHAMLREGSRTQRPDLGNTLEAGTLLT
jgi:hypothetical protein